MDYEVRAQESVVTVLARMAPGCAATLSPPVIAFVDETGARLTEIAMRGNPNSLRGRLQRPDHSDTDQLRLAIIATDRGGAEASIDATDRLAAQLRAQSDPPGQGE